MEQAEDDIQLIEQIQGGCESAFKQLFQQYFQYLHNVAYNRIGSKQVADDIVQDIFTDVWKNRTDLNIHTSVSAYLYQAVRNKVYNFIRYQSSRQKEYYIQRVYKEYYANKYTQESSEILENRELHEMVTKSLNSLPEKSQNIFHLSREKEYTHREIAEELNCSQKTVEYHIGKVLKHLRLHLKDYVTVVYPVFILYM